MVYTDSIFILLKFTLHWGNNLNIWSEKWVFHIPRGQMINKVVLEI